MTAQTRLGMLGVMLLLAGACSGNSASDGGTPDSGTPDAGTVDAGAPDSGSIDAGAPDSGPTDAGAPDSGPIDSGTVDAGTPDSGAVDGGVPDSGALTDAGPADSGSKVDSGPATDAGLTDAGSMTSDLDGGTIGAPCAYDTDCVAGSTPTCITAASDFPFGYCSSVCTKPSDCGAGAVCASGVLPASMCFEQCTSNSDCAPTYLCQTQGSQSFCLPNDCRVVPATCTAAQTCDTSTGSCTPAPQTAGYPAAFPTMPQVVNAGNPPQTSPILVPIFFANDNDPTCTVAEMTQYYQQVGASRFWQTLTEYSVGAPAAVMPVTLTENAADTYDDTDFGSPLQQLLAGLITSGAVPEPDSSGNTLYILNFPIGTTVTQGGSKSCIDYAGYHADMQIDDAGAPVAYAVMPRCSGASMGLLNDLQTYTSTAAHELVEGVTNPYPDFAPAWSQADNAHIYFDEADQGSELGDMCENDPLANYQFPDFDFVIQRIWSNAAATAGHDPCVPELPNEVFFNSVPVLSNTASFPYQGTTYMVDAVNIAVGSSGTVTIPLYSDNPTSGSWDVQAFDVNAMNGGNPLLSFGMSSLMGDNGAMVMLTVNVLKAGKNSNGMVPGTELFEVVSTLGTGTNQVVHQWWGLVNSNP